MFPAASLSALAAPYTMAGPQQADPFDLSLLPNSQSMNDDLFRHLSGIRDAPLAPMNVQQAGPANSSPPSYARPQQTDPWSIPPFPNTLPNNPFNHPLPVPPRPGQYVPYTTD